MVPVCHAGHPPLPRHPTPDLGPGPLQAGISVHIFPPTKIQIGVMP